MSTHIAIGYSRADDVQEAAQQAGISAKNQLNTASADLAILLTTPRYATPEALAVIQTILKPQRLVGSCAPALILSDGVFPQGIAVLAIESDEMAFGATGGRPSGQDLRTAGFDWGRRLSSDFKSSSHQACLMFTDQGLHNSSHFIRGAQEVLGLGFPLVGAVISKNLTSQRACQFYQNQVLEQSATGVLISGVQVAVGNKHGFKPLGKPRTVTKVQNNLIIAIDGKPALQLYEEFLGPESPGAGKGNFSPYTVPYPLGIFLEEPGQYLLKNAVDILSDGSIVCQGEVPEGSEVHLMIGNKDSCKNSAIDAANQVKDALGGRQAKMLFIIESYGRHKILKQHSFIEIQAIKDVLGYTTPIIGMYAQGEIVPWTVGQGISNLYLQNDSIVILAVF